jgi:hypothetical protein
VIVDHRTERSQISLPDALMSGLAVSGSKYPLLLYRQDAYTAARGSAGAME